MESKKGEAVATTWKLDPAHTLVEFSAKHMMITAVKGRFREVEGTLEVDEENPDASSVRVEIEVASLDTGVEDRDNHLRSSDFLDAENHPKLTFRNTEVRGALAEAGDDFRVIGDLTIRGVTKRVELDCVYHGKGPDPWGGERVSFSATTKIDRRTYGVDWNQALGADRILVGNEVTINVEAQAVAQ